MASDLWQALWQVVWQVLFGRKRKTNPSAPKGGAALAVLALALAVGSAQTHSNAVPAVAAADTLDLSQPLTIKWRYQSNLTLNLTPAPAGDRIYLPLAGGTIVSVMAAAGQLNWRSEIGGELSASPVADERVVFVASETGKPESGVRRATGALRALGREGGVTQWMRTLATPLRGALALGHDKLFAAGDDGRIYAFDSRTGVVRWSYDYGTPFKSHPVVVGSQLYLGCEDGNLLALNQESGKLLWRYRTRGAVRGPVAEGNDQIFFGSGDGYVYAVGATSGRLAWRKRTGAGVEAVVRAGEGLLAASLDNFVYQFSLAGARLWKRRLPGRISSQPLVTPGAALFMPLSSANAIVLELRAGRQLNFLAVGEEITTSAAPVAVGSVVLLTTENGLVAFAASPLTPPAKN